MNAFLDFIITAIPLGMTFLYGCTGEILTEKAGHLNLGIPGIMCIGGAGGCLTLKLMYNMGFPPILVVITAIIASFATGILMGALYSFLTVTLKANQNVTGLAMTTLGVGISDFIIANVDDYKFTAGAKFFNAHLPFADSLGKFGELFFSYGIMIYLSIAVAIVTSYVLNKTKVGLHLRAVGENPATADAAGINVTKYRYVSTCKYS